jgi:hypothetical protein
MIELMTDLMGRVLNPADGPALDAKLAPLAQHVYRHHDSLVFTIRGLYQLLQADQTMSYWQFRIALYQDNLNQQLAVSGYTVVLFKSNGKVDSNWYQLRQIDAV